MMKKKDNHSYLPTLGWWKDGGSSTIKEVYVCIFYQCSKKTA